MTVLLYAALLPAIVLMVYVYKKDHVEREPVGVILKVFLIGAAMGPVAGLIESMLFKVFESSITNEIALLIIEYFIGVALVEELCKFFALNTVRRNPAFNYVFDGIVYGAAAALGFAALENVLYVFDGGMGVAISRAIFAVPGHFADGVTMGCFYGLARKYELLGDRDKVVSYRFASIAIPVLEHGFYDTALSTDVDALILLSLAVDIAFIGFAIYLIRRISKEDEPFNTLAGGSNTPGVTGPHVGYQQQPGQMPANYQQQPNQFPTNPQNPTTYR